MKVKRRIKSPTSDLPMTVEQFKGFTNQPQLSDEEAKEIMLALDTLTKLILKASMN